MSLMLNLDYINLFCSKHLSVYLISLNIIITMKYILLLFSIFLFSQEVSRSTISVTSSSADGYYISQSIGQFSIIGFFDVLNKSIVQGYKQPTGLKTIDGIFEIEPLQLYPIPVSNELNLQFSMSIEGICSVELFDRLGRLVLSKNCVLSDFKTTISLSNL